MSHAKFDTTQFYSRVSIRQRKQVHTLTHPAKMGEGERVRMLWMTRIDLKHI